jgi:hypothetical protein
MPLPIRESGNAKLPLYTRYQTLFVRVPHFRFVPCVDGPMLSRDLSDIALLVGAAMCSAC